MNGNPTNGNGANRILWWITGSIIAPAILAATVPRTPDRHFRVTELSAISHQPSALSQTRFLADG